MIHVGLSAALAALMATTAHAEIAWPDPTIPVPLNVRTFIAAECIEFHGWGDETVEQCISREMYGYRAVISMLMDAEHGDRAAERYRDCAVGLGRLGGRFHRRKADCISMAFSIVWRFEFSEKT